MLLRLQPIIEAAKYHPSVRFIPIEKKIEGEPDDKLKWIRWFKNHILIPGLSESIKAWECRQLGQLSDEELLKLFKKNDGDVSDSFILFRKTEMKIFALSNCNCK